MLDESEYQCNLLRSFSTLSEVLDIVMEAMQSFSKKREEEKDEAKVTMLSKIIAKADEAVKQLREVKHSPNRTPEQLEQAQQVRPTNQTTVTHVLWPKFNSTSLRIRIS